METDRPSLRSVVWRSAVVTVVTALALWLLAAIVPGFSIESGWDALLAGFVVGVGNAIIWPAMAFLVVPAVRADARAGCDRPQRRRSSAGSWICSQASRSTGSGRRLDRRRPGHRDDCDHSLFALDDMAGSISEWRARPAGASNGATSPTCLASCSSNSTVSPTGASEGAAVRRRAEPASLDP